MAFKTLVCKGPHGLPILEFSDDGDTISERLSPGTIREEDYYIKFRWSNNKLFACPRGSLRRDGKCRDSMRLLRIRHPMSKKSQLLRECRNGKLAERRASSVEAVLRDLEGFSGMGGPAPMARFLTVATLAAGFLGATYLVLR